MNQFEERRTIRKYTSRNIDAGLLNKLLETSCRTATLGNLQLYSVVVTRNEKMKEKLAPFHFNQPMVKEAPVVLTFCADFNRTVKWYESREAAPGYDNFLSFLNAATDALLLTQTFCNLAEEAGLGTCFLGTTIYNPQQIIEALRLPTLVFPVATITIGYPDEKPDQVDRLPLEAIVHDETYRPYTEERIDRLYQYKESLSENRYYVEVNHKKTLAQVFTDIRYTRKDNEALSANLLEVLRRQGFLSD